MSIYALYPSLVRPFLFCLDPENAHSLIINLGKVLSKEPFRTIFSQRVNEQHIEFMGLEFKNQLGLAAGMDKNGDCIDYFGSLGFGHIEVGTVTPKPQSGNSRPRMFRVKKAHGLINRMGFNNKGVDYLVKNLVKRKYDGILGVSIGKNETTPLERASEDYLICMRKVYPHCDYIAINVSCPNTPGLTALQEAAPLVELLTILKNEQKKLTSDFGKYVPLVVKIAPDLEDNQIEVICNTCLKLEIDGISCTNTTTQRDVIYGMEHASEWGGLSGEPLRELSTRVLRKVRSYVGEDYPIIGLGGIDGVISAREKLSAGAGIIQLYSSFVYQGPQVIKDIVNNI